MYLSPNMGKGDSAAFKNTHSTICYSTKGSDNEPIKILYCRECKL